jgi:hypothetical protein
MNRRRLRPEFLLEVGKNLVCICVFLIWDFPFVFLRTTGVAIGCDFAHFRRASLICKLFPTPPFAFVAEDRSPWNEASEPLEGEGQAAVLTRIT